MRIGRRAITPKVKSVSTPTSMGLQIFMGPQVARPIAIDAPTATK
jgi:hypothetical protein